MDRVTSARVQASLGSMGALIDLGLDNAADLTDDEVFRLVEAAVLEGQFILETLSPGSVSTGQMVDDGPNPTMLPPGLANGPGSTGQNE